MLKRDKKYNGGRILYHRIILLVFSTWKKIISYVLIIPEHNF